MIILSHNYQISFHAVAIATSAWMASPTALLPTTVEEILAWLLVKLIWFIMSTEVHTRVRFSLSHTYVR